MTTIKDKYELELKRAVQACIENHITDLHEVLLNCEGADPKLVNEILSSELKTKYAPVPAASAHKHKYVTFSQNNLPAPNPSFSQWWFAPESINDLILKFRSTLTRIEKPNILCIGTPSLAIRLSEFGPVTLMDIDTDVIKAFTELGLSDCIAIEYDVNEDLPVTHVGKFNLVILDPPWYDNDIRLMLNRSLVASELDAEIFCTLPGRLTRPEIEDMRSQLIKDLVNAGHNLISFDHDSILYDVPPFEKKAFKNLSAFKGLSWRKGDIFHVIKKTNNLLEGANPTKKDVIKSFARNPKEFRVFLNSQESLSKGLPPKLVEKYSENVSTRAIPKMPDLWTTTKIGLHLSDSPTIQTILSYWASNLNKDETKDKIISIHGIEPDRAQILVDEIEKHCSIWSKYSSPKVLRDPDTIINQSTSHLSHFAVSKTIRIIKESSDNYRPAFSRDRDRIIWSNSLKRLADKTQLFPGNKNDTVRTRLTHTLEVAQLASTIGASLGLNGDLIEASALAHDLGHTPFGHAGENAINKLFNIIDEKLGGFNHYEHGLDTVLYIESPYQEDNLKQFFGLNLSPEILEAILKHTYHYDKNPLGSVALQKSSKHTSIIPAGYCHLEGQAVRISDKISYLISDIEDGLNLGAISVFDLTNCSIFHRSPLYFKDNSTEPPFNQFIRQRKYLIKLLMEDIIEASTLKLSQSKINSMDSIRNAHSFIIGYSEEIESEVNEVWRKLQTNLLFKNKDVLISNLLAAKIISELVILFTLIPDLIDSTFKINHMKLNDTPYMKSYKTCSGGSITLKAELLGFIPFHLMIGTNYQPYVDITKIPVEKLILAKDYVCSLSDFSARKLHKELLINNG